MARASVMACFVIVFLGGLYPPESPWLIGIGLIGFFASFYVPKDF